MDAIDDRTACNELDGLMFMKPRGEAAAFAEAIVAKAPVRMVRKMYPPPLVLAQQRYPSEDWLASNTVGGFEFINAYEQCAKALRMSPGAAT